MAFRLPRTKAKAALQQSHRAKLGTTTEALVELHNDLCERMGLCALRRVPTPMRVLGPTPKGVEAVYTEASTVDYMGWTFETPTRPVLVEVKHVEMGPAGVRFAFTHLKPKQRADLASVHAHGGVAVLLVVCNGRLYPVPWPAVAVELVNASMVVDAYRAKDPVYLKTLLRRASA